MSAKLDMTIPLVPSQYYHIYNRGNNGQLIFYEDKNYVYFLKRYGKYMNGYWNTFSYALLPNHFHLFIQVKSGQELVTAAIQDELRISQKFLKAFYPNEKALKWKTIVEIIDRTHLNKENFNHFFGKGNYSDFCYKLVEWIAREPFRRFLLSYSKSINQQEHKVGSLFQKHFRRKRLEDLENFKQLTKYIHRNPIHHGMALDLEDSDWTSYSSFFSAKKSGLKREEVLTWFDGIEVFQSEHKRYVEDWKHHQQWMIEE